MRAWQLRWETWAEWNLGLERWSPAFGAGRAGRLSRSHHVLSDSAAKLPRNRYPFPLELEVRERAHADTRHQNLILGKGYRVADVLVQQIVADEPHIHLPCAEPGWIELCLVADLRLQQVVARRRGLGDRRDVVLRERVQQINSRKPVGVTIKHATAQPLRRNAWHVGSVVEGRTHDVILALDAPNAGPDRHHVVLELE